ncbi:MAG: FTR1 family protein [Nitrospinales bacterium]
MPTFKTTLRTKILNKTILLIVISAFILSSLFTSTAISQPDSTTIEAKVKKIVMMLNIVKKEYEAGISKGKIINAAEYEESQVFLEQAFDRYKSISALGKNPANIKSLEDRFISLTKSIKNKVDHTEVNIAANGINSDILKDFEIKLSQSPTQPVSLKNGRKIYFSTCHVCHGASGNGAGPLAAQLNPKPAIFTDPGATGNEETTPFDNFQIISVGIANTGMVGWADQYSESELWDVTYFIRTFSNEDVKLPLIAASMENNEGDVGSKKAVKVINEVKGLLKQSLAAYENKKTKESAELAFDSYLAYENLESGLIGKKKELGLKLESSFGRLQAEIKREASLEHIQKISGEIDTNLSEALVVLTEKIGFAGLFLQSFSIIVREGFEAILIIAALIAFLIKSRNEGKLKAIYMGSIAGIIGSFITAYIVHEILNLSVTSQEVLEGWIMLVAVVVLFWVSYWLVSKIEAQKWQSYITSKMRQAIGTGSLFTLGLVAFLSVYREGFETVLFYKALYLYAGTNTEGIIPGFLAGTVVLAGVYYLINQLGVRVPIKWFFIVTSVFLYYMAFTFMGKGLHELQMGEILSITPAHFMPTISWLGIYPTWETFIGQMILVAAYVFALVYTFGIKPEITAKDLQAETHFIQKNIAVVHDLVEHISLHAKRCEIFLKDTKDQDLKELVEHLQEIDEKVHELADHTHHVENQLLDEYDRLSRPS